MSSSEHNSQCIFCQVIGNRLPASIVHSEADWMVVMDIHPMRQGHALILPRRHAAHLGQFTPDQQQRLFVLAAQVLQAQQDCGLSVGGANLLLNDGVAANQHIPHLHLHCIPRRPRDSAGFALRLLARTLGLFGRASARAQLDAQALALRQSLLKAALPAAA